MNRYTPNTPEPSLPWWRRRPFQIVAGLLLASCCFWSGLAAWLFASFTYFMANRLSYVHGKAELIAPAEWHPGGILSPDGRYMVTGWSKNGPHEEFVWDLTTGAQYPYKLGGGGGLCWLNPDQFAVLNAASKTYYLVQARGAVITPTTLIIPWKYGLELSQKRWRAAQKVYVLENFGYSGHTVFTLEQGQPYAYINFGSQDIGSFPADIPHTPIRERCSIAPLVSRLYSPDGQFYTRLSSGSNPHVLIYTREGKLVAEAYKDGWTPRLMGWSYDSSGVYFQMLISGSAAAGVMPDAPIFKLSPLTPEEQRWVIAQRVGLGVGIVGLLVGGWWWWRRRRSREQLDEPLHIF